MAAPVVNSTHVLIDPMEDEAHFAANAGQTTGGSSIITTYDRRDAPGYGWFPTQPGIRSRHNATSGAGQLGGFMTRNNEEFGPVDGTSTAGDGKRLFYTHNYSSQGSALNGVFNVGPPLAPGPSPTPAAGYGFIFWLFSDQDPDGTANTDRTANCRGWCSGGRDTIPTLFSPHENAFVAVDAEYVTTEVVTGVGSQLTHIDVAATPNRFDPARIVAGGWTTKSTGTNFKQTHSRFGYYDAYTVYEGDSGDPAGYEDLAQTSLDESHWAFYAKGSQFLIRAAIEIGHSALGNTQPTTFSANNASIQFEEAMVLLDSPKVRVLHAPFNKIGLEQRLRPGDSVTHVNCTLTSPTPWHFRFAANVSATVLFSNCIVQNAGGLDADCEIDGDVIILGGLIDACGELTVNAGTIQNLSVTNPTISTGRAALEIDTTSTIEGLAFSTNAADGHAIRITAPGTYGFTGMTYVGYGGTPGSNLVANSGPVNAMIYNDSGGAVTINVSGGDTPSVRNAAGSTTTVVSGATQTFTGIVPGSIFVIYDVDDPDPQNLGTELFRSNSASATEAFAYSGGANLVNVTVIRAGYKIFQQDIQLTGSDGTFAVNQVLETN